MVFIFAYIILKSQKRSRRSLVRRSRLALQIRRGAVQARMPADVQDTGINFASPDLCICAQARVRLRGARYFDGAVHIVCRCAI